MVFYIAFEKALAAIRQRDGSWGVSLHLAGSQPQCLAVDPLHPAHAYCGTFDRGLWRSADAGALVRSLDGGRSWEDRKPGGPFDTHTLIMHRLAPDRLYSAAGDGFVQSDDGGETWHRPDAGLGYPYLWSAAASPADPDTLVVSAAPGPQEAHTERSAESAIYRRFGRGPWQQIREGLPSARGLLASVLAANEAEADTFYAANNKGLFRSIDGGLSWEELPIGWPGNERLGRPHALVVAPE
jgi:hypothetical protein